MFWLTHWIPSFHRKKPTEYLPLLTTFEHWYSTLADQLTLAVTHSHYGQSTHPSSFPRKTKIIQWTDQCSKKQWPNNRHFRRPSAKRNLASYLTSTLFRGVLHTAVEDKSDQHSTQERPATVPSVEPGINPTTLSATTSPTADNRPKTTRRTTPATATTATASRRSPAPLFQRLGATYGQQMGPFRSSRWIPNSLPTSTASLISLAAHNSLQQRATTPTKTGDQRTVDQTGHRTSTANSRLFQPYVCNPQAQRGAPPSLQPASSQPIRGDVALQNGNITASGETHSTQRLPDIDRPFRRLSAYPGTSTLTTLPAFSLGREDIPVPNDNLWPVSGTMAVHPSYQTNSDMGEIARNTIGSLPRRLESHGAITRGSSNTNSITHQPNEVSRMASQLQKVSLATVPRAEAPWLQTRHQNNDDPSTGSQDSRSPQIYTCDFGQTGAATQTDPQSYDENTSSYAGDIPNQPLHTGSHVLEELSSEVLCGLGHTSLPVTGMHSRAPMVVQEPPQMEWTLDDAAIPCAHNSCGCQQQRMGWSVPRTGSPWPLDSGGSKRVDQLERVESNTTHLASVSSSSGHDNSISIGQHDRNRIRQQARRHSIATSEPSRDRHLGKMPRQETADTSTPHPREREHSSRFCFTSLLQEKHLEPAPLNFPADSTEVGPARCRPLCGSHNESATSICLLEDRSNGDSDGCNDNTVDKIQQPLLESTLEYDSSMPEEDPARTNPSSDDSGSVLAIGGMVPNAESPINNSPSPLRPSSSRSTFGTLTLDKPALEAIRLAGVKRRFESLGYTEEAMSSLMFPIADHEGKRMMYRRAQHLFIQWAMSNDVDLNHYTSADLTNFLAAAHMADYSVSTL